MSGEEWIAERGDTIRFATGKHLPREILFGYSVIFDVLSNEHFMDRIRRGAFQKALNANCGM